MPLLCTESGEKDAEISLEATKNGCTPRLRGLCTLDFFTKLVVQEQDDGPVTPRGSPWCDPAPPEYPVNSIGTALHQAVWTCRADAELRRHLNINNDDELRAAFKRADTNGDGELSHDEWAEAFGHVVEDTSCRSMLWRLFQDIDTDKNDKIDENEFVQGLHAVPPVSIRLRQLVEDRSLLDTLDEEGQTALYVAATRGDVETTRLLLTANADVHITGTIGEGCHRTPLYSACRYGSTDCVKLLLEHKADAEIADENGVTPLFAALETHQMACVEALLQAGVDANSRSRLSGDTAIAMAAYHGLHQAILLLIKHGGDPHALDECGRTAVFAAASSGQLKCLEILLAQKVDVQVEDEEGETALSTARDATNLECVEMLLQAGAKDRADDMDKT